MVVGEGKLTWCGSRGGENWKMVMVRGERE